MWASWIRRSAIKCDLKPLYRTVLLGLFFYLWPIILFLFPQLTSPKTLLGQMCAQIPQRTVDSGPHYYGMEPLPFWPPRNFSVHVQREVFLDLRSGHLISLLQQSSASATNFVLAESGWEQSFTFTPLDKYQLSSPRANLSPTSITKTLHCSWVNCIGNIGEEIVHNFRILLIIRLIDGTMDGYTW